MVLDANTQVGDRYSSTNIHLLEFHSTTIGWAAGFIVLLIALTLHCTAAGSTVRDM